MPGGGSRSTVAINEFEVARDFFYAIRSVRRNLVAINPTKGFPNMTIRNLMFFVAGALLTVGVSCSSTNSANTNATTEKGAMECKDGAKKSCCDEKATINVNGEKQKPACCVEMKNCEEVKGCESEKKCPASAKPF